MSWFVVVGVVAVIVVVGVAVVFVVVVGVFGVFVVVGSVRVTLRVVVVCVANVAGVAGVVRAIVRCWCGCQGRPRLHIAHSLACHRLVWGVSLARCARVAWLPRYVLCVL